MWYERIKRFYDRGLWTIEMVAEGIRCNKISEEEYKTITGEDYVTPRQ